MLPSTAEPVRVAYRGKPAGYCLACGAGLAADEREQCPWCERRFDFADVKSFARDRPSRMVLDLRQRGIAVTHRCFLIAFIVLVVARGRLVPGFFDWIGGVVLVAAFVVNQAAHAVRWRLSENDGSTLYARVTPRLRRVTTALGLLYCTSLVINIPERFVTLLNTPAFHYAYRVAPDGSMSRTSSGYFGIMFADRVDVRGSGVRLIFANQADLSASGLHWRGDEPTLHDDWIGNLLAGRFTFHP